MSPTLLSKRLKQLESEAILERRWPKEGRGPTYHLTEAGREFIPLVEGLGAWGQRWSRRELVESEIDLGLLLWGLERSVNAAAFPDNCAVVRLEFTDQPSGKDQWWFVNKDNKCELCIDDPGIEVSLYLACTLPDMIYVVRGDLSLSRAISDERLEVLGSSTAKKALRSWLNLSPLTKIKPKRPPSSTIQ